MDLALVNIVQSVLHLVATFFAVVMIDLLSDGAIWTIELALVLVWMRLPLWSSSNGGGQGNIEQFAKRVFNNVEPSTFETTVRVQITWSDCVNILYGLLCLWLLWTFLYGQAIWTITTSLVYQKTPRVG